MKTVTKTLMMLCTAAATMALPGVASANRFANNHPRFAAHHPRQAEVIGRERHQMRRITEERREGDLTAGQAHALRAADRSVVRQDRADSRANGGYITKAQKKSLNQEENGLSKQIGQ